MVATTMRYHAVPMIAMLVLTACSADTGEDDGEDSGEVTAPHWEETAYGCWAYGEWSEVAYEGAGFVTASMEGEVKGHPVRRIQAIQLRESHPFSMDTYPTTLIGAPGATEWQWHAHCDDGSDRYGRWWARQSEEYFGTGCTTTSLRVRVRAANCLEPVAPY